MYRTQPVIKHLNGVKEHYDDLSYENGTRTFFIRVPKNLTTKEVYRFCKERYTTRCHHSYDCCGRWYSYLLRKNVRRVKRGEYAITVSIYRNV